MGMDPEQGLLHMHWSEVQLPLVNDLQKDSWARSLLYIQCKAIPRADVRPNIN